MRISRWMLGSALALLLLAVSLPSSAEIGAAPLGMLLDIPAGESKVASIYVTCSGEEPEHVSIELVDWFRTPEGMRYYAPGTVPRSLANWVEFLAPTDFILQPGEQREVRFTVTVPQGVDGSHWAMFIVKDVGEEKPPRETQAQMEVNIELGLAYAIKVIQTDPATAVREAGITGTELLETDPLKLKILFENMGNAHLMAKGWVEVRDSRGETVRRIVVREFGVLPGEVRAIEVEERKGGPRLRSGRYIVLAVLDFGGDYLAAAQMRFDI